MKRFFPPLAVVLLVVSALDAVVGSAATLPASTKQMGTYTGAKSLTQRTCTLTATSDSYVDQASATSNFNSATFLGVRSRNTSRNARTFVRFDLTGCSFPAGSQIQAASLRLHMTQAPSSARTHNVQRITANWGETTITWNNQPSVVASATATANTGTTSGVNLTFDVVSDVNSFVAGTATNLGWSVRDSAESFSSTSLEGRFATRASATTSQRPTLTVTYY